MKLKTNRVVTKKECPWLEEDLPKGTIVYPFYGATYGCITPGGSAVTKEKGTNPFFELPTNVLNEVKVS